MIIQDPKFIYDTAQSMEYNFQKWRRWNRRERESLGIEQYGDIEARKVFDQIFINLDGNNKEQCK
tara:strand:- start:96 stop:290 length:195 start_codon:yes stop_codon:yes gene_type:complete